MNFLKTKTSQTIEAPSKTALFLIENSPLGLMGTSRMYMGCHVSGLIKFALFISVFVGFGFFDLNVSLILSAILGIWVIYDWMTVVINSLSRSTDTVFCSKAESWANKRDIKWAFWLSVLFGFPQVVLILTTVMGSFLMGFETMFDNTRKKTKTEKYIPSAHDIKEFMSLKKKINK